LLGGRPSDPGTANTLHEGQAFELEVGAEVLDGLNTVRARADDHQLDVNIVPSTNRRKRLLIADMDSTIITSESLDDMAEIAGLSSAILPITARAMRGELDFEAALDERVALLRGLPTSLIEQALDEARLTAGACQLVQTMRANGAECYLVSGGFTAITGPIAVACGFHGDHANILETKNGRLTGTVAKPVLDRDSKLQFLDRYCASLGIGREAAACIGDGANDLAMLQAAGLGVAFNGKPLLREAVTLQLNHTDLTGLLYLQGYRQSDFVVS
ncbi:MAG: phosphoserine phosphatase SerB, partial [Pseudomonadota bacterium]|nr:phosphoserine phosphatase SerB [Pseudomonadota bacterium]